jgi:Na+-translocating ferredoxin:NAD+ oxidoreductase RnfG subunit
MVGALRLALIAAAIFALAPPPGKAPGSGPEALLAGARAVMPDVVALGGESDGMFELLDAEGTTIGWTTSTFPQAASISGYNGPSELLVVFDAMGKVRAARLLESADTIGHVDKVMSDTEFWAQWDGKPDAALGDPGTPRVVSGATLTSEAMARGVAARFGAKGMDQWFTLPIEPATVDHWFPGVDRIEPADKPGVHRVFAGENERGLVLRASRMGVGARGFNGVSDVLVALDGETMLGVALFESRDNEPYVGDTKDELRFADPFAGKKINEYLASDDDYTLVVSGASVTANAVTTTVREMLRRHLADPPERGFPWPLAIGSAWLALGLVLGFAKRWSGPGMRMAFALVSVAAGLGLGWMLGQDQLISWGKNGLSLASGLPVLLLTAVALLVPAFTGKNVYCSRICPHGAAQTLLGKIRKRRSSLPGRWHRALQRLPWLTLVVIWVLAFVGSGIPFALFEPFEVWSAGFYAFVPAAILTIGFIAAVFLPQAYCHYGCPTGALLKFLSHSPGDFTRRDAVAAALVALGWLIRLLP